MVKLQTQKWSPLKILFNWFVNILGASKYTSKKKKETILQLNVYHVTQGIILFLLFSLCSLYVWLIDGRSLVKRKLNHLIKKFDYKRRLFSSAINSKDSIDTGAKHGTYSVNAHSEKYSTWYMKYGKYNISLLMPK